MGGREGREGERKERETSDRRKGRGGNGREGEGREGKGRKLWKWRLWRGIPVRKGRKGHERWAAVANWSCRQYCPCDIPWRP